MEKEKKQKDNHLRASPAGMVYPLVMKSLPFDLPSLESFVKRLFRLSFALSIFRRLFLSFSSSRTRAVSTAVEEFLIPVDAPGVGVDVLLLLEAPLCSSDLDGTAGLDSPGVASCSAAGVAASPLAFFLRFFEPGAFFKEWLRPCSASFWPRAISRCLSASFCGRIGMTFSSAYDSLHWSHHQL